MGVLVRDRKPDSGRGSPVSAHWAAAASAREGAQRRACPLTDAPCLPRRHASPAGLGLTAVVALVYVIAILYEE